MIRSKPFERLRGGRARVQKPGFCKTRRLMRHKPVEGR